jgi:Spy/CpxP family protein refolding chaperone
MRNTKTIIIAIALLAATGFIVNAFAHDGMGWGSSWRHHGSGWHHRGQSDDGHHGYNRHRGGQEYSGQTEMGMSDEEIAKLSKERQAFLESTESLRKAIWQKESDLRRELEKENPDVKEASTLQEGISKLRSEIDQKHLNHLIALRAIDPRLGKSMMNYGRSYGGHCWD